MSAKESGSKRPNEVIIDTERCKGCGLCVWACPRNLIHLSQNFNEKGYYPALWEDPEEKCRCLLPLCYLMCPDTAIKVKQED